MNIDYRDRSKPFTAEDLIRRYGLDKLAKDRKALQTVKEALDKTDTIIEDFVKATLKDLENLQNQVDGNIMTWFFSGVPTLENSPANEWKNETDKINHLGDLYYDRETGFAYRFTNDGDVFSWVKLKDSDITEALALANSAQDTADSKRRVFIEEPIPPYDVGDIWIKEDKDLYRCRAKRIEGSFDGVDWCLATNYSNDDYAKDVEAILNQFKETVESDYVTTVLLEKTKDSIDASVKSTTEELRTKFNDFATIETLTQQINSVEAKILSNEATLKIINETLINGVPVIKTSTGFTFNSDGMKVDSTNAKTSTTIGAEGMNMIDKATSEKVLFAGYDPERKETLVEAANMIIKKYLIVPHARFEKYYNQLFEEECTGCYHVH